LQSRRTLVHLLVLAASLLLAAARTQAPQPQAPAGERRWFRGNTHTHTVNSDGDSAPDAVVRWYREHGYQFVVITDHDMITPVEGLNALFAAPEKFLIVAGEEVSDRFSGTPVHLNAIAPREVVKVQGGATLLETVARNARAIRSAGGVVQINHPNFGWALNAEALAAATDAKLFELANAHPLVNNHGGGGSPSTEEIWDAVLSTGRVLYAAASDDTHHLQCRATGECVPPGKAWIMVRARQLTAEALVAALEAGDFYATTGVRLASYEADARGIRIALPENTSRSAPRYRTLFIGKGGAVLKTDTSMQPACEFRGDELYVRARVESSDGSTAWTQPVFPIKK